jgi:hypothetical protein
MLLKRHWRLGICWNWVLTSGRLQPYIRLLGLKYPVDDLRIQVNSADEERVAASNAALKQKHDKTIRRAVHLMPDRIFVAVHRLDETVYYRRLPIRNTSC